MAAVRKLMVEVVDARNLLPKDGQGTSSPYVVIDYYGQRRKTHSAIRDLNPTWNEVLAFNVGKPSEVFTDMLELDVYQDRSYGQTRRNNFLGRIRLSSSQFVKKGEEALIYYPLEKKSLLSWTTGEIGLKIYYIDAVPVPPTPVQKPEPPVEEVKSHPPAESVAKLETPSNTEAETTAAVEVPVEAEGTKFPEERTAEAKAEAAAAAASEPAPSLENAAAEGEKEALCDMSAAPEQGQDGVDHQAEAQPSKQQIQPPPSMQEQSEHIEFDFTTPQMTLPTSPSVRVNEASVTGSVPEIKVDPPIPCPQPISRTMSMASYASVPSDNIALERSSLDLVEKMHYLFVRVVKGRFLPAKGSPVVKIDVANNRIESKPARKTSCFEWDQTFAVGRDAPDSSSFLEVGVWGPPRCDV